MKQIIFLLASILMISACSFEQDPLAGAPDSIRTGQPPEFGKPVPEKPIPKEALQIDAPQSINGRVGIEVNFKVEGRVAIAGVGYVLKIVNLKDFEGATFDQATGEFRWVPSRDLVRDSPSVTLPLTVFLFTEKTTAYPVVSSESKTLLINIVNEYTKPIINKIESLPGAPLVVGYDYKTSFQVEDQDAYSAQDTRFQFGNCKYDSEKKSIGHLVSYDPYSSKLDPNGRLSGVFTIDLRRAYNLRTGSYCFSTTAYSSHGLGSQPVELTVNVEGKPAEPVLSIGEEAVVNIGEMLTFNFSIFDPQSEGIVTLNGMDDIGTRLPGSSIKCVPRYTDKWNLGCTAILDARKATQEGSYLVTLKTTNTSVSGLQKTSKDRFFRFSVKAAQ